MSEKSYLKIFIVLILLQYLSILSTFSQTETPTFTPTSTFTFVQNTNTPTPSSTPFLDPNIHQYDKQRIFYSREYIINPAIAMHPTTNEMFIHQTRYDYSTKKYYPVILGPIQSDVRSEIIDDIPPYTQLPLEEEYSTSINPSLFLVTSHGNIIIQFRGILYQINQDKSLTILWEYYRGNTSHQDLDFYLNGLIETHAGDNIPGAQPGDLIGFSSYDYYVNGRSVGNKITFVRLIISENKIDFHIIYQDIIPYSVKDFTRGDDGYLYVIGREFEYDELVYEYVFYDT